MSEPDERGKFSTDISQDVIEEALRSVKRHTGELEEEPVSTELATEVTVEAAPDDGEVAELKAQLELSLAKGREMMDKVKESHERMLRAVADLENFKKRAAKERDEVARFGAEKLLKDLLPVIDNLDRALEHARGAADFEGLKQGLAMTRKLFEDSLARHGVKAFVSLGAPFDPRFHEAMQQVETSEVPPNQVLAEVVRGFMLHDRLVRPALVTVSKAAEPKPDAAEVEGRAVHRS